MDRVCNFCHVSKELVANYRPSRGSRLGLATRCNECVARYRRELRKSRPAETQAKDRARSRTLKGRFTTHRSSAIRRGIEWTISLKEFEALIAQPCAYCSGPLPETGSGLDRKYSGHGYTIANVVPCCTVCNIAKSDVFTHTEMLKIGEVIREIRKTRVL